MKNMNDRRGRGRRKNKRSKVRMKRKDMKKRIE